MSLPWTEPRRVVPTVLRLNTFPYLLLATSGSWLWFQGMHEPVNLERNVKMKAFDNAYARRRSFTVVRGALALTLQMWCARMCFWLIIAPTNLLHRLFACCLCCLVLDSLNEFRRSGTDTTDAHKMIADHCLHTEHWTLFSLYSCLILFDKSILWIVSYSCLKSISYLIL